MANGYYQAKLDALNTAIATVETGGQDVGYEGRRIVMADLAALYRERARLEPLAAREAAGGGIRVRLATPV